MQRRAFLKTMAAAGAVPPFASLASVQDTDPVVPSTSTFQPGQLPFENYQQEGHRGPRTLLFLDYYPLMRCQNLTIKQATAQYVPEGRFVDPHLGSRHYSMIGSRPFYDAEAGLWRRFEGFPDLYAYESDDAILWRCSQMEGPPQPQGGRQYPHHLYHCPIGGYGSSVLHVPDASDGYAFKMLVLEHIGPSYRYALEHPDTFWHPHALQAKAQGGASHFHWRKHSMLVSRDGRKWELRRDFDWGTNPMIIEEHYALYHNHHRDTYHAVHRPRWGDRRLFQSIAHDCQEWSAMRQMLHPDVLDKGRIEFHGCAIDRYDSYYVGLLWYGMYDSFDAPAWSGGPDSTHFIYSYDGEHFIRGHRQPLIPLRQPHQPPFRGLWSRATLPMEDRILLYSDTWEFDPDALAATNAKPYTEVKAAKQRLKEAQPMRSSVIHELRKDGFAYLEPDGEWGQCQTIFLTLFSPEVTINADARVGELHYEVGLTGRNEVAPGFSYQECLPMIHIDDTAFTLRFRDKALGQLMDRPIYFRFKLKRARLYAIRGDFSADFTQRYRLEKGMPLIEPTWLF